MIADEQRAEVHNLSGRYVLVNITDGGELLVTGDAGSTEHEHLSVLVGAACRLVGATGCQFTYPDRDGT